MNEAQIQLIVERVLAALGQSAPPTTSPRALVLFSGAQLGFDDSLAALRRLAGEVVLDWTQTQAAEHVLDQSRIQSIGMQPASKSLVSTHQLLIVPTLTVNLAAKVAHGVGDSLASNVMAEFIMSGRPVVAAVDGVCPDGDPKRSWFPQMPAGYQEMLRQTLRTLRGFGVRLSNAAALDVAVRKALGTHVADGRSDSPALRLVTEATVAAAPEHGRIPIRHDTIVTDLARERARERGITLELRS